MVFGSGGFMKAESYTQVTQTFNPLSIFGRRMYYSFCLSIAATALSLAVKPYLVFLSEPNWYFFPVCWLLLLTSNLTFIGIMYFYIHLREEHYSKLYAERLGLNPKNLCTPGIITTIIFYLDSACCMMLSFVGYSWLVCLYSPLGQVPSLWIVLSLVQLGIAFWCIKAVLFDVPIGETE